jgi:hypothetical protein
MWPKVLQFFHQLLHQKIYKEEKQWKNKEVGGGVLPLLLDKKKKKS